MPYVPLNYRLADSQLVAVLTCVAPALAVVDPSLLSRLDGAAPGLEFVARDDLLGARGGAAPPASTDPDAIACCCSRVGTTGEPKAAVLRHRHLTAYVLETRRVPRRRSQDEAALVSVPPYHIAGISAVLTSVCVRHGGSCTCRSSTRPPGWRRRAPRRSPMPWSCRPCSGGSST